MEFDRIPSFVDETGQPFDSRIEGVLRELFPRLRRQFPSLNDEVVLIEILEEAGQRIAAHELRSGQVERLHGYAWVTVRNVAMSRLRRSASRINEQSVWYENGEDVLSTLAAASGTPEQIEQAILLRELFEHLTQDERLVCTWKRLGFSSQEIAEFRGSSPTAVDTLFSRAKDKIRRIVGEPRGGGCDDDATASSRLASRAKRVRFARHRIDHERPPRV